MERSTGSNSRLTNRFGIRLADLDGRVGSTLVAMSWDLWLDYHRIDAEGLTHGNVRNAMPGVSLVPGRFIVVGNEDADRAVAEVVRVEGRGVVLVRVLPGSVDEHADVLFSGRASASG